MVFIVHIFKWTHVFIFDVFSCVFLISSIIIIIILKIIFFCLEQTQRHWCYASLLHLKVYGQKNK